MAFYLQIVVASLIGSLHCAGMCGPLVAFAVGDPATRSAWSRARLHAAYHGGRLISYSLVGALCGVVGVAINHGAVGLGFNQAASLVAGILMVAAGLMTLLQTYGARLPHWSLPQPVHRLIVAGQRAAFALHPQPRAWCIGLLTALLPCGWLYMFAVLAAGTGSPVKGAAVMAAFWLGSVPTLLAVGIGVQTLAGTLGRRLPLVTATAIILLGLGTLWFRLQAPVYAATIETKAPAGTVEQVQEIQSDVPPCCRQHGKK